MERGKLLIMSLLATAFFGSCTNTEEPVTDGTAEAIEVNAGIAEATRAVIGGGYTNDLEVSFVRLDNPGTAGAAWTSIDAVRTGGAGNTALTFEPEQTYLAEEGESVLIGYYPRKEPSGTTNPASVIYTITGDEDIMATGVQTGSLVDKFETFTFSHLLTQLQFKCVGSAGAISKWTAAHPLHLRITTTKDGNGNLKETLSNVFVRIEGGFEIGKSHIVSLFFTEAANIQTTYVSVEAWMEDEQGEMPI